MPKPSSVTRKRIGQRDVADLAPDAVIWDTAVRGFGVVRRAGPAVTFVLLYRTAQGRARYYTIGRPGSPWTAESARAEARRLLGEVVTGADPAASKRALRHATTIAELCDQYLADAEAGRLLIRGGRPKKPLTLASDRGRIAGHIKPLLGALAVAALTRQDVERFMHDVAAGATRQAPRKVRARGVSKLSGGRGVATRTIGLLGAILRYGVEHGLRPDNPAHGIRKFAENKRERRLADAEYVALGVALQQAAAAKVWPFAIACLHFLALTGWRSGEALALRWRDLDLVRRVAILPDSKTGRSVRPLSQAACDLLRDLGRGGDAALVFQAARGDGSMTGFKRFARRILALGELPPGVTPHVLRHSFVSLAADLGLSEPTIAALVGHKGQTITARYVHFADATLLAAADIVADETARRMRPPAAEQDGAQQPRLAVVA